MHEWSGTSWDQMGESINGEQNYHSSGYAEENNQGVSKINKYIKKINRRKLNTDFRPVVIRCHPTNGGYRKIFR